MISSLRLRRLFRQRRDGAFSAFDVAGGQPFGEFRGVVAVMILQSPVEFVARVERVLENRFGVGGRPDVGSVRVGLPVRGFTKLAHVRSQFGEKLRGQSVFVKKLD